MFYTHLKTYISFSKDNMNKIKWRVAQFLMLVSMAIFNLMSVSSEKISTDGTFVCGFPMVTKMQELMLGFTEIKTDIKFLKKKIVQLSKEVSYLRKANKNLREGHRRLNVSLKHLKSTCSGVMKTDEIMKRLSLKDCASILKHNPKTRGKNGVYTIYPEFNTKAEVYCDMTTEGGGWTVSDGYSLFLFCKYRQRTLSDKDLIWSTKMTFYAYSYFFL
ncbi:fibroleukin-like [Ostrea edulis]|uniref:fibroleukin-like n=1 Tax=Ostrea edulis TaxID=37623 RepID=UPI0024AFC1FA|nr:fibroleukin-like [Ostrea edulis]